MTDPAPAVTAPAPSNPLDLGAPAPSPLPTSALDLGPAPSTSALDLGPPPTASPMASSPPTTSPSPSAPGGSRPATGQPTRAPAAGAAYRPRRIRAGDDLLLTGPSPTLTLTRLQSGTGALRLRVATSDTAGDLRLGCAYELTDGTSLVQRLPGPQSAPPDGRRPVIRASSDGAEVLTVDLAQVRRLRRMAVYACSGSGQPVAWAGTLTVEMLAGTRVRIPLDRAPSPGVLVLLSIYNVDGELVLRHEDALVDGPVRAAALAFGFDRITWVDDQTPLI